MTPDEMRARVASILSAHPEGLVPASIVQAMNGAASRSSVYSTLDRMLQSGEVARVGEFNRRYAIVSDRGAALAEAISRWHPPPPPAEFDYTAQ